jgi:RNA polymerase sigma-70 factor (ECF subfamily)
VTGDASLDSELARKAATGDRAAFSVLVRAYGARLAALVRAYGVASGDVEDVVQETFVAAWRGLADFDTGRPFRAWIFQIALNKARDWRRRRQVRRFFYGAADLADPEAAALEAEAPGPDALAHQKQFERAVRSAVEELPADLKQPFLLSAFAEMTYAEIAESLRMTVKTVEGRLIRARRLLRAKLPAPDEPD